MKTLQKTIIILTNIFLVFLTLNISKSKLKKKYLKLKKPLLNKFRILSSDSDSDEYTDEYTDEDSITDETTTIIQPSDQKTEIYDTTEINETIVTDEQTISDTIDIDNNETNSTINVKKK